MKIDVYTDGSATVANKPGGWAFVMIVDEEKVLEKNGHMELASNNDAEMEAAIQGLGAALKFINDFKLLATDGTLPVCTVTLCSDSQLVLGWADGTYRFKQVDKLLKYRQLKFLVDRMKVKTRWVRGHSGDEHNERCDKLANQARLSLTKQIQVEEAKVTGETLIGKKKTGTICIWYKNCLKVVDLESNIVETYDRSIHGPRGSMLEIREEKSR